MRERERERQNIVYLCMECIFVHLLNKNEIKNDGRVSESHCVWKANDAVPCDSRNVNEIFMTETAL